MWSYSGDPATSPKDEVRYLIGDTDPTDQQLSDEEIQYALFSVYGENPPARGNLLPAVYAADQLVARYARAVDTSLGDLHVAYGNRVKQYQDMRNRLSARAALVSAAPFVGGTSREDKRGIERDRDRLGTAFRIDGMDDRRNR